ncbi:NUDIX domain-containing protein [Haladaptatus sp. DYF46]|uniref:NUDIX domain-containing protein n=1 Tax=Haladaptatus sp. DYF46 TaxID=2886041 RepID=UPI001E3EE9BB|nr:NUDIX domain-containing protein [Haladaptatus sp. DYF46]
MTNERERYVGQITQKAVLFGPEGNVLVTKVSDHWEPPGGRFEYGETLVGGLRRELREELDVDARIGPPVDAAYGGWLDAETGNPVVTLVYRCETDETEITLNDEHDDYEWMSPEAAAERLRAVFGGRMARSVERAASLDDAEPFAAVTDPYADTEISKEEMLAELAAARAADPPETTDI